LKQKKRAEPRNFSAQDAIDMASLNSKVLGRTEGINKYYDNMTFEEFKQVDKVERLRKIKEDYEQSLELDEMRYLRPDVESVMPASKTDMYGNQVGDIVHKEGHATAKDPR